MEVVVAYFKVLYQQLTTESGENYEHLSIDNLHINSQTFDVRNTK
jgi:hypothetical protein